MKSRSRRGCAACLEQHKKCDESRPVCRRCSRLSKTCDYSPRLRWFNGARLPRCPRRPSRGSTEESTLGPASDGGASLMGDDAQNQPESPPEDLPVAVVSNHDQLVHYAGRNMNIPRLHGVFDGDLCSVLLPGESEQSAYIYFVHCVSLILPGHSDHRNGYRQLAAFALQSPMLLDTILSIATTYMNCRRMTPRSVALATQSRALASLRRGVDALSNHHNPCETPTNQAEAACLKREVLATILLQITVEICNGTSAVGSHIGYAASLFRELGYCEHAPTTPIGLVLTHRMAFVDVLSSILWRRRPLLSPGFWFLDCEAEHRMAEDLAPRFQDTTGCPFWVVRILARISHLVADVEDGVVTEADKTMGALTLEGDLAAAAREYMGGPAQTPSTDQDNPVETVGRCYYWSAVILLQTRVFLDARSSPRVQMSLAALLHLLTALPIGCGPDSALSLPLYTAGLAAVRADDRALIRDRSQRLDAYYPSRTRTALTAAFGDMWAAADAELDADPMRQQALFIC